MQIEQPRPERQKDICAKVGISPAFFSEILNGKKRPSPEVARELERVTGINRLAWLYPSEYRNPLIAKPEAKEKEL